MRRSLITAGLVVGGLALAACGSGGPGVQARQTGETTTTTESTTTTSESTATTAAPSAPAIELPCTADALTAAYNATFGKLPGSTVLQAQKCVSGWATSTQFHGFDAPTFGLYRAEGDHWVAVSQGGGKLCEGHGVPAEIAPQIGCES